MSRRLSEIRIARFKKIILAHYEKHGRSLPWRETRDPYRIFVSEIMLQQTQVSRVMEKYPRFIDRYPNFHSLAAAPLSEVLSLWQGLGYNRRALFLKRSAERVIGDFGGRLPDDAGVLASFPGIGANTAFAIVAFAFNKPAVFIETNIRSVFTRFFFKGSQEVNDREIFPLIASTLYEKDPRTWYWALMDFGVMIKARERKINARSAHYVRQPPFKGSNRELRGMIIRALLESPPMTENALAGRLKTEREDIAENLRALRAEGLVMKRGQRYTIAG